MSEPFSRIVGAGEVSGEPRRHRIAAAEDERRALARALGIDAVEALQAELTLQRGEGAAIRVRGSVTATIVQTDVVTLEPVRQEVAEAVDLLLVPAERPGTATARREVQVPAADEDVYRGGRIDLGVIASEHLALGLDPYPRAAGVAFADHVEDGGRPSPFAGLAGRKKGDA